MYTSHQRVMSCHFPGGRASAHTVVALEDKHCKQQISPPPSSFSLASVSQQASHGMEYPLVSGSAVLIMSPPKILPTPALLVRGRWWSDSADAVPALLSSSQNAGVLWAPLQLPMHSTALGAAGGKMNAISAGPNNKWKISPLSSTSFRLSSPCNIWFLLAVWIFHY